MLVNPAKRSTEELSRAVRTELEFKADTVGMSDVVRVTIDGESWRSFNVFTGKGESMVQFFYRIHGSPKGEYTIMATTPFANGTKYLREMEAIVQSFRFP